MQDTFCNLIDPDSYVLVSAAGCQTIQLSFDYDAEADFSSLQTYDWMPAQNDRSAEAGSQDDSQLHDWVTDAVDAKLAAQGFRLDREGPGFLVRYEVPVQMRGNLTLAFVHADSRQLLWQGVADDEAYLARNAADWEKRIHLAVDMLLDKFPPSRDE